MSHFGNTEAGKGYLAGLLDGDNLERVIRKMKICKNHKKILKRGMTYEIVAQKDCLVCQLLAKYED